MKYDFNLDNATLELLPPDKRLTNNKTLLKSLLSVLSAGKSSIFTTLYTNDLKERIYFNGQKIILEYAINDFLGTTFNQPPTQSQSYITNGSQATYTSGLLVGKTTGGAVAKTTGKYVGYSYTFYYPSNFQINVPAGTTAAQRIDLKNFINKYIPHSINFTIV